MAEEQELIPLASEITVHCAGCTCTGVATTPLRDTETLIGTSAGSNSAGPGSGHVQVDLGEHLGDNDDVGPCEADVIATNLQELNSGSHEKLRIAFHDWNKSLKAFQERRALRKSQQNNIRTEIYQVIGFYIVFQGVIYTAAAQSPRLLCRNWWTSFLVSSLTSVISIGVVQQKLYRLLILETTSASEKASAKVLKNRINNVILHVGTRNFDINRHARDPIHTNVGHSAGCAIKLYSFVVVTLLLCFSVCLVFCFRRICFATNKYVETSVPGGRRESGVRS